MAKVCKENVRVGKRDDYIHVEFDVNVNVDGLFTTTLKPQDVELIESYKIELATNKRSGGRTGYFSSETKKGLIQEVRLVLETCMSKELIEEKIVLQYSFYTCASFGFALSGEMVPNMGWSLDGELNQELYWQNGTANTHSSNPQPVGVQMYIKPCFKRKYQYLNGVVKEEYSEFSPFGGSSVEDNRYYLKWLEGICSTRPPDHGRIKEIEYTEERAKFFVQMYKAICKLAYNIAQFEEPEKLIELADSGKYLMGSTE